MDKKIILHRIRNPWRIGEEDLRKARLAAADLIERQAVDMESLLEEIEDLKSEIENLHIENDTLCLRLQNKHPLDTQPFCRVSLPCCRKIGNRV